ncbi:MAG TPA: hypothetical protein VK849_00885 [Longimicrobiales bacterium]|nr:hypothetical protein [Longimicrobiales bacterium]
MTEGTVEAGVIDDSGGGSMARLGTNPPKAHVLRARHERVTAAMTLVGMSLVVVTGCKRNHGTDQGGPLRLSQSEVHVLGSSEAIALVRDLEVLPDGTVWLLNSVEPFFIGFGPNGERLTAHGESGGGPEEFRMPSAFTTRGWRGEAWVLDLVRHALIRVSQPGEWSQISLPREEMPPGSLRGGMDMMSPAVRTARIGDEVILPRTTGSMEGGLTSFRLAILGADLVALDPETGLVREIVGLGDVLDDPSEGFVATEGGFPLWYRLWAVCGGEEVRVYDRVRNQLRGFSPEGEELPPVRLPALHRTEVTPREFAQVVFPLRQAEVTGAVGSRLTSEDSVRVLSEIEQGIEGQPHELAAYLPRYVDFRCADDGVMWMQPLDLEVGGLKGGASWVRIARDGEVREVHLPERFDAMRFTPDRVWGLQRDELDVASVAWIDLPEGRTR